MPTLPLFTATAFPDASHRVTAPGGYEWWRFDAEDAAADTRIVVILYDGFVFDREYLRKYAAYRRWPTRRRPPVASEFPNASVVVYRGGRVLAAFDTPRDAGTFEASADGRAVSVGPNRMTRDESGAYLLHFEARGLVVADLVFTPRSVVANREIAFPSHQLTGADHRWLVAAPLCSASGSIRIKPVADAVEEIIEFAGRGAYDRQFGTGPQSFGMRRWLRGRILKNNRTILFQIAASRVRSSGGECCLVDVELNSVPVSRSPALRMAGDVRLAAGIRVPAEICIGDALKLIGPQAVSASPFVSRVLYTAQTEGDEGSTALCDVVC